MEVVRLGSDAGALAGLVPGAGSAVTIGEYDGVHLGHRDLIARTKATAATLGCLSAVVTFDRHPATVVRPESAPLLLTDLDQKLELLAATGVDLTLLVHFDRRRAEEDPEDFVREVLVGALRIRSVVVGHDFHFGRDRRGNVELLTHLGAELAFDVTGLRLLRSGAPAADGRGPGAPAVVDRRGPGAPAGEGEPVSSTRIRALLAAGDVEGAAELLGRHHQVRGTVGHGDARGRQLGFPTANVGVPRGIAVPADGVYAGWYLTPERVRHPACISVGRQPTFRDDADRSLVEAYLLDFSGDLYGQDAAVEFASRQRAQRRFDSAGALVEQMARDVEDARALLTPG